MALKVSRPSGQMNEKLKLSKFGKIVVAVAVVLVVVVIAGMIGSNATKKAQATKDTALITTIERSITVCKNSLDTLNADSKTMQTFEQYKTTIESEKNVLKKSDIALTMIGFVLQQAQSNQTLVDELNGSNNRMFVAIKTYKEGNQ